MTKKMEDKSSGYIIPESILSDLCSRFIINVPEEERNDLIRIFFQIEIAHWFYLDFYCESSFSSSSSSSSASSSSSSSPSSSSSSSDDNDEENETNLIKHKPYQNHQLKPCSIRTFAENIFRHCPFLMQHSNQLDDILSKWKVFKHAVPTNGAIILDETMRYVLLVQGFWAKASWGFPKGKVFEEETEAKCAIREVLEETGYDISNKLVDDEYLQININDQTIRLYIITDVSKSSKFEPKTRREIKEVRWFPIDELPVHRKDIRSKHKIGYSPNSFFMVIPFVKSLKKWIALKKGNLSGELINGKIVNLNKSSVIGGTTNNSINTRSDMSSVKHRRHNSHSHSNNHNHHHNHHQHHNQHHHQHHNSHHHSNNYNSNHHNSSGLNNSSYKTLSRSNENLTSLNSNKSNSNSAIKKTKFLTPNNNNNSNIITNTSSNAFLKHFSSSFSANQIQSSFNLNNANGKNIDNLSNTTATTTSSTTATVNNLTENNSYNNLKQQSQFYQKMQQNELADLLSLKEAALNNKTNKQFGYYNNNSNSNSKFKPINNSNNINNCLNVNNITNTNSNSKQKQQKESMNSNLNNSGRKRTSSISMKHSASYNFGFNMTNTFNSLNQRSYNNNNNNNFNNQNYNQHMNINKVKKQLEFNGPECWVNFKFDYDSIIQNLPPLIEL